MQITNWIIRGVNANAQDVYQLGVQANDPFSALELAVLTLTDMKERPECYPIAPARVVGDNYEPGDIPPNWDNINSIVGWRVEPVRGL